MEYINECFRCRPSRANPGYKSPYEMRHNAKPDVSHLRPWGCVCYVHEDTTVGFEAKARKGYLLGCSKFHATGVYDVVMADTKRIRQTMNVSFVEDNTLSPPDMPDALTINLRNNTVVRDCGWGGHLSFVDSCGYCRSVTCI